MGSLHLIIKSRNIYLKVHLFFLITVYTSQNDRQSNSLTRFLHIPYNLDSTTRLFTQNVKKDQILFQFSSSSAILQTTHKPLPHLKNYFFHLFCSSDFSPIVSDSNVANCRGLSSALPFFLLYTTIPGKPTRSYGCEHHL